MTLHPAPAPAGESSPAGADGRHTAVVDLGFGDAGKGTVVDWLCTSTTGPGGRPVAADGGPEVGAVVRFNGGAQAAHNVVTGDGRHHTFSQFGSGTLAARAPGSRPPVTFLSRFMLVEPLALAAEADHLAALGVEDPYTLLHVDPRALLTTPYHAAANRARERARGQGRHGSCGIGVGETVEWSLTHDAPRVADIATPAVLRRKLAELRDHVLATHHRHLAAADRDGLPTPEELLETYAAFAEAVTVTGPGHLAELLNRIRVVFEGAQGVLLDEARGFHPHTTWSKTTTANLEELLAEAGHPGESVRRLGVVRAYTTRHGAGPMPTEDPALAGDLPEPHNGVGRWQGGFRVGHFDAVAHAYAVEVAGHLDALAVTHLDAAEASPRLRVVRSYLTADGTLDRIVPGRYGDLEHQEQLTGQLLDAVPVLEEAAPEDWAEEIGRLLGLPVALTSHGPTAADKAPVPACAVLAPAS